jgi:transposase
LERFPSATRAAWLSEKRLGAWLRANGDSAARPRVELFTRLDRAAHGIAGDEGDTRGAVTLAFVAVLKSLRAQIGKLDTRIDEGPAFRHIDRHGRLFPDPESLACLAGVAPSTRASGRHHTVTFRWAAEKRLRDALCDFAGDSWRANAWAQARYR